MFSCDSNSFHVSVPLVPLQSNHTAHLSSKSSVSLIWEQQLPNIFCLQQLPKAAFFLSPLNKKYWQRDTSLSFSRGYPFLHFFFCCFFVLFCFLITAWSNLMLILLLLLLLADGSVLDIWTSVVSGFRTGNARHLDGFHLYLTNRNISTVWTNCC